MINTLNHQQVQQLSFLELKAKEVVEGFITGLHKSPYHGFSVEFAEHRPYNTGESTKNIDWKLFGKTEKLFVKQYEEETNLRSQIIIDTSQSMLYPTNTGKNMHNKLSYSIYSAASLIYLLKKQRDASGLSLFSDKVYFHSKSKLNNIHLKHIFYQLENTLKTTEKTESSHTQTINSLHEIAERIRKRSLVIIFSDMFDNSHQDSTELFSALQHLKHNKHDVVLFHVLDKEKEKDLDFENRPYKVIDIETQELIKLNPNTIKEQYQKKINAFENELKLKCGQYQVDYVQVDIKKDYTQVLMPFLLKRQKLY